MFLGLRGVGKTVLLNAVDSMAQEHGHVTSFIEAPEGKPLGEQLLPRLHQALRKLSLTENAKAQAHDAMRA
ncbi:MAG: ATP-binding protein, partial [Oxalobacteraceae bacterium]